MLGLPYQCLPYLSFGHPAHRHRSPLDGIVWALSKWSMSSGKRHLFRWFGKETPRFGTNWCFAHHLSKQQKQRFQTKCMAHNQPAKKALLVHFIICHLSYVYLFFRYKKLKVGYLDTSRPFTALGPVSVPRCRWNCNSLWASAEICPGFGLKSTIIWILFEETDGQKKTHSLNIMNHMEATPTDAFHT